MMIDHDSNDKPNPVMIFILHQENNLLGVIDMAMVLSTKNSKHVKNGFEIAMSTRSYHLSTKTPEEREEWLEAIQNTIEWARANPTSTSVLSNPAYSIQEDPSSTYSLVEDTSHAYSPIGGQNVHSQPTNMSQPAEYSLVGDLPIQSPSSNSSSTEYSVLGGPSQSSSNLYPTYDEIPKSKHINQPSQSSSNLYPTYDEIPKRHPVVEVTAPESIYDVIRTPSPYPARKLPLNDTSGDSISEGERSYESTDKIALGMSSFMSKFSMESLNSIESLDFTDDENFDYDTDGEIHEGDATILEAENHASGSSMLLEPVDGHNYAAAKIKEFFKMEGIQPSSEINYTKIDKDYNLKLELSTEFPAFEALKKFLVTCN